jgi:hypothetical protein
MRTENNAALEVKPLLHEQFCPEQEPSEEQRAQREVGHHEK